MNCECTIPLSLVNPGHVHPGKIFTSQPTTTPRRALGDLSNNAKKTPSTVLKQESQTLSVQKPKGPTKPSKTVKAGRESTVRKRSGVSVAQVQQQQKVVAAAPEEFPDIELMPVKGDKGELVCIRVTVHVHVLYEVGFC